MAVSIHFPATPQTKTNPLAGPSFQINTGHEARNGFFFRAWAFHGVPPTALGHPKTRKPAPPFRRDVRTLLGRGPSPKGPRLEFGGAGFSAGAFFQGQPALKRPGARRSTNLVRPPPSKMTDAPTARRPKFNLLNKLNHHYQETRNPATRAGNWAARHRKLSKMGFIALQMGRAPEKRSILKKPRARSRSQTPFTGLDNKKIPPHFARQCPDGPAGPGPEARRCAFVQNFTSGRPWTNQQRAGEWPTV